MSTNQPSWHCIANLGDATPSEYGGAFVLVDKRGVYTPELWLYDADSRALSCFSIERCTPCPSNPENLGDNRFHPELPAWFGTREKLESAADSNGMEYHELEQHLTSSNPMERAWGYLSLVGHYGDFEFDQYPRKLTRKEATVLCNRFLRQIAAANNWQDGIGK